MFCAVAAAIWAVSGAVGHALEQAPKVMYPTAIFPFQEQGQEVKGLGPQVSDILFAKLVANPDIYLVDRNDLQKTLEEAEINLSGMVTPGQATQVGQLTGAKILVTGSVMLVGKKLYLVAKIIGTETSRVLGASTKGEAGAELDNEVGKLAEDVAKTILEKADQLVARPAKQEDLIAALKAKLGDNKRPVVFIHVTEHHVGQGTPDPAAQTELTLFCKETGFEVIDPDDGVRSKADVILEGQGFSEFAIRRGNLVSVKARLEVKAVDPKTDKIIATDRQTAVVVDLSEQVAGKAALQQAAAQIADRLLPKLVTPK
ncbi:MAG: hypothetical protein A3K19_12730 [Lentisphaerae bacterium RIFOXYB12_FULL_65_16]|nr:MAG: hypothetical protein A3K18_24320 [Lentisphaerae bacterium RIFOXYA12_64_32]OGV88089.1 MAG: hypothetical protein A3K19_12730 [Lentisphaerae bacterium RIFOXYB12_FULL_65_16]